MYILLIVLTLIASILLICVVHIQKSKGGGLSSSFAGSNQIMGVRRTNSFIEKVTWILGGCVAVFAILSVFFMPADSANTSRVSAPVQEQSVPADFNSPATPAADAAAAPAVPAAAADAPAE